MACADPSSILFAGVAPGDRVTVFTTNCSPSYLVESVKIITTSAGADVTKLGATPPTEANPYSHVLAAGEVVRFQFFFDPSAGVAGKKCEVHGRVRTPNGTDKANPWCTTIVSGTSAPDIASFGARGSK